MHRSSTRGSEVIGFIGLARKVIRALYGLAVEATLLVAVLYGLFHFLTTIFAAR